MRRQASCVILRVVFGGGRLAEDGNLPDASRKLKHRWVLETSAYLPSKFSWLLNAAGVLAAQHPDEPKILRRRNLRFSALALGSES